MFTIFYNTSTFVGYCFGDGNGIHPKRSDVFSFKSLQGSFG